MLPYQKCFSQFLSLYSESFDSYKVVFFQKTSNSWVPKNLQAIPPNRLNVEILKIFENKFMSLNSKAYLGSCHTTSMKNSDF